MRIRTHNTYMPGDSQFDKLDNKITALAGLVQSIAERSARIETALQFIEKNSAKIDNFEHRITALEALEVSKYDERLETLEQGVAGFRGWLSGAVAVIAAVGGIAVWYLNDVIEKLAVR